MFNFMGKFIIKNENSWSWAEYIVSINRAWILMKNQYKYPRTEKFKKSYSGDDSEYFF